MPLTSFQAPSFNQILQSLLNDYRALTTFYGYNLSIDPGSEVYLRFSTQAGQIAVLYQLMNVLTNSKLIDTATGSDLDRVANDFGLQRRGATSATGFIQLVASVSQVLIAGKTLTGPNGLQYQVTTTGVYNPNQNVPVNSVDTGTQANLGIGNILTWTSPQANMQSTCLVSIAITGGADSEDDDTLRSRLYLTLQSPPQMGNDQQVVTVAGSVDSIIQQAFVYSNFNGAGTQLVALTGYQTTSYIGRDIPHLQLDGYVKPYGVQQLQPGLLLQNTGPGNGPLSFGAYNTYTSYLNNLGQNLSADTNAIYGQLPGPIANPYATVITTVNNLPTDVAAVMTLPYPVGAGTNGFGNGWEDFTPWPVPDGYYVNDGYCKVTAVQGVGTVVGGQTGFGLTIRAPSSGTYHTNPPFNSSLAYSNSTPTPGTTHVQWVNRSDLQDAGWLVVTATVLGAQDNGNDTWNVVLDTPLVFGPGGTDFYGSQAVWTDGYEHAGVAVGDFIFPASVNAQNYLNTLMQQYALLGPGQVTSSQGLLVLGASRYPSANAQFPNVVGVQAERALVSQNNEVYAASVNSSSFVAGAQPNLGAAYNTAYSPPSVNAPPNIFVPRNIGFYPQETYGFGK